MCGGGGGGGGGEELSMGQEVGRREEGVGGQVGVGGGGVSRCR